MSLLNEEPAFCEPWEARAFAITLVLHERGLFTWDEWTRTLGAKLRAAAPPGEARAGVMFYGHWVAAIESLVTSKSVSSVEQLEEYQRAWDHAAARAPHGRPLELQPVDFEV